ncbi:regulator of volume decrease after cellular swelling-domain-containing protein [Abortiporus biennis]|nr:regulator of volume decrease after cellular swelling-domain-containing protein [Abortiporus biennis]
MAPITFISELPKFISREEHKTVIASTPSSFSDIPPVLRHKEENVSISLDPPLEGFSSEDSANGTLYVIESVLVFLSSTGRGFQVEYPTITLHAISRAESGPSIYCQLDETVGAPESVQPDENEDTPMRELSIVPKDTSSLEAIFEALSDCASLHPDPAGDDEMDDDDDAFIDAGAFETFNGDEDQELSEVGKVRSDFANDNRYAPY